MKVEVTQTVKKYKVSVNLVSKTINVVLQPIQKKYAVEVARFGLKGDTGLSAYQIALNNGFIGSEVEWLQSLTPINVEHRIFNETPIGVMNGSNIFFTSRNDFVPGSVTLFLNGIFQRIVMDFNTVGTNTIILSGSPSSSENILINYNQL